MEETGSVSLKDAQRASNRYFPLSNTVPLPNNRGLNRKRRLQRIITFHTSTSAISHALTRIATSPMVTSTFSSGTFRLHTDRRSRPMVPLIQRTTTRNVSKWISKELRGRPTWRETPGSGGHYAVHIPICPQRSCPIEVRNRRSWIPWFRANMCSGELTTCGDTCYLSTV